MEAVRHNDLNGGDITILFSSFRKDFDPAVIPLGVVVVRVVVNELRIIELDRAGPRHPRHFVDLFVPVRYRQPGIPLLASTKDRQSTKQHYYETAQPAH